MRVTTIALAYPLLSGGSATFTAQLADLESPVTALSRLRAIAREASSALAVEDFCMPAEEDGEESS